MADRFTNKQQSFRDIKRGTGRSQRTDLAGHHQRAQIVGELRSNDPTRQPQSQEVGGQSSHADNPSLSREPLSGEVKRWLRKQKDEVRQWFFQQPDETRQWCLQQPDETRQWFFQQKDEVKKWFLQQTDETRRWFSTLEDPNTMEVLSKQNPKTIDQQVEIWRYNKTLQEKYLRDPAQVVTNFDKRLEECGELMYNYIESKEGSKKREVIIAELHEKQDAICSDLKNSIIKLEEEKTARRKRQGNRI